jgi:hypothetical protein
VLVFYPDVDHQSNTFAFLDALAHHAPRGDLVDRD